MLNLFYKSVVRVHPISTLLEIGLREVLNDHGKLLNPGDQNHYAQVI